MEYHDNHDITQAIIGCCYNIHNQLGPGFPERIYSNALKKIKANKFNIRSRKRVQSYI